MSLLPHIIIRVIQEEVQTELTQRKKKDTEVGFRVSTKKP
jgi:hypothetical protein